MSDFSEEWLKCLRWGWWTGFDISKVLLELQHMTLTVALLAVCVRVQQVIFCKFRCALTCTKKIFSWPKTWIFLMEGPASHGIIAACVVMVLHSSLLGEQAFPPVIDVSGIDLIALTLKEQENFLHCLHPFQVFQLDLLKKS